MIAIAPIALDQISPEWIADRREIIVRDGYATRAGEGASIEIKSLRTNEWLYLVLPGGARDFVCEATRDAVLRQLLGEKA